MTMPNLLKVFPPLPMCPPQYLSTYGVDGNYQAQDPLLRVQRVGVLLNAGAKCPILRIRETLVEKKLGSLR